MRSTERKQPKHPLEPEGRGVLVFLALPFVFLGLLFFFLAACGDAGTEGAGADRQTTSATDDGARVIPREASTQEVAQRPEKPRRDAGADTTEGDAAPSVPVPETFGASEEAFHERRWAEATAGFAAYTERTPENPWGHYMLGLSAWKGGDLERAEEALSEATRLDPEHTKSWINLARVRLDDERPDDALDAVRRAVELEPERADALRVLGRVAHESGDVEEALDAYRRAVVADPDDAWAMNNLGLLQIQRGAYGPAAEALARAVQLRDDVATFQNNLGVALERTGHLAAAAEAYRRAQELSNGHDKARVSLARVEEQVPTGAEAEPAELEALAEAFVRTTEEWRVALDATDPEGEGEEETDTRSAALPETGAGTDGADATDDGSGSPGTGEPSGDGPSGERTDGADTGEAGDSDGAADTGDATDEPTGDTMP